MANHLFKNLQLVDSRNSLNGQFCDIEVIEGKITKIGPNITSENSQVIECKNSCVSPGLFDMQVTCGEPGEEEKETFSSLDNAAVAGGVTGLLLMPSTHPACDNRSQVEFIVHNCRSRKTAMYPSGSISVGTKGIQLAEMTDMRAAGALAFTDDKNPLENSVLVHLALQYNQISGGLLLFHAEDAMMSLGGKVNEGLVNVQLGLKGAPSIAEDLGVVRLLTLAKYHTTRIHIQGITSATSVSLIRNAKKDGIPVTCSTYAHHLFFNDEVLKQFDSRFKVWPPLRSENDRKALIEGVLDGTIDVISSDHRPQTIENKNVEFDYAKFGSIGLESLWSATVSAIPNSDIALLIERMSHTPRKLLGLKEIKIAAGEHANFFIYNLNDSYTFNKDQIRSKSANSAFLNQVLKGKIKGTYSQSSWFEC
jgi:dihydroorotase